jgi:hypothetical protein
VSGQRSWAAASTQTTRRGSTRPGCPPAAARRSTPPATCLRYWAEAGSVGVRSRWGRVGQPARHSLHPFPCHALLSSRRSHPTERHQQPPSCCTAYQAPGAALTRRGRRDVVVKDAGGTRQHGDGVARGRLVVHVWRGGWRRDVLALLRDIAPVGGLVGWWVGGLVLRRRGRRWCICDRLQVCFAGRSQGIELHQTRSHASAEFRSRRPSGGALTLLAGRFPQEGL